MIIPIKPWLEQVSETGNAVIPGGRSSIPASGLALSSGFDAHDLPGVGRGYGAGTAGILNNTRMEFYHEPIMGAEILEAMRPVEGKQVFDGTLGGGGHSELFLENGAHVIGCDQDGAALDYASRRLARFGDQFLPVRGNFAEMDVLMADHGLEKVDGILLDVGVSSRQLDDFSRGFSFREDADLDMRMDDRSDFSAKDLVNEWSEDELIRIFFEYGEEKRARRAAAAIVSARADSPIETTLQLAAIVEKVIPKVDRKHPATRIFQAIRIAVNRELECLEVALKKSVEALAPGGVLAVIAFHSLEDRIVKHFLRDHSTEFLDRPEWPEPRSNPDYVFRLPSRRAITPTEEEIAMNPRARSAKLRVAVKL